MRLRLGRALAFRGEPLQLRRKILSKDGPTDPSQHQRREAMIRTSGLAAAGLGVVFCIATMVAPLAADTPKRGGILTFMIPADAPPRSRACLFLCRCSIVGRITLERQRRGNGKADDWHVPRKCARCKALPCGGTAAIYADDDRWRQI